MVSVIIIINVILYFPGIKTVEYDYYVGIRNIAVLCTFIRRYTVFLEQYIIL